MMSWAQKVEAGARSARIAVTNSVTGPSTVCTCIRLPGCTPNRPAICAVTDTASAPVGAAVLAYVPATTLVLLVSVSR